MVEQCLLHGGVERDGLELAEARRARRLDDDQPADGVELESRGLDDGPERFRVQAVEVPDVAVESADGDDGVRVQPPHGEHRPERVEVRVPVGGDYLLGPHALILPPPGGPHTCAIASISTRAPLGSCEMPTVERAGGRSPT